MTRHYIAMAGLHGCLPQYSACCESYQQAVDCLAALLGLGRHRKQKLERDGCLGLNLGQDGNEYCEVIECDCERPQEHEGGD